MELSEVMQRVTLNAAKRITELSTDEQKKAKAMKEVKEFCKKLDEAVKSGEKATLTIKADTLTTSVQNSTRGMMDPDVTRLAHRRLTDRDWETETPIVTGKRKHRS